MTGSYRQCVGIMLLNECGEIWVGERIDRADSWQMPQGGIDDGEAPYKAALRELQEETSITTTALIAESANWHSYDIPPNIAHRIWKGKYKGQTQKWYLLRFTGNENEINITTDEAEFTKWKWLPHTELIDSIVPFKRDVYRKVLGEFEPHIMPAKQPV